MTAALCILVASVIGLMLLAYFEGRADERRSKRLRGERFADGLLAKKHRVEGRVRL